MVLVCRGIKLPTAFVFRGLKLYILCYQPSTLCGPARRVSIPYCICILFSCLYFVIFEVVLFCIMMNTANKSTTTTIEQINRYIQGNKACMVTWVRSSAIDESFHSNNICNLVLKPGILLFWCFCQVSMLQLTPQLFFQSLHTRFLSARVNKLNDTIRQRKFLSLHASTH